MSDIKKSFADLIGNTPLYAAEKFAEKGALHSSFRYQRLLQQVSANS